MSARVEGVCRGISIAGDVVRTLSEGEREWLQRVRGAEWFAMELVQEVLSNCGGVRGGEEGESAARVGWVT